MKKTELEILNDFLTSAAKAEVGIRRKAVVVNKFINELMQKNFKNPEKEYLVLYLYEEDTPPALKWCTKKELGQFDKFNGKHQERIIIQGGTILSDTLTVH